MAKCKGCVHKEVCPVPHLKDASVCAQFKDRTKYAEVVQCKDCKHYRNHPNGLCYAWTEHCTNERGYKGDVHCVEPDDFCSYGERREGE